MAKTTTRSRGSGSGSGTRHTMTAAARAAAKRAERGHLEPAAGASIDEVAPGRPGAPTAGRTVLIEAPDEDGWDDPPEPSPEGFEEDAPQEEGEPWPRYGYAARSAAAAHRRPLRPAPGGPGRGHRARVALPGGRAGRTGTRSGTRRRTPGGASRAVVRLQAPGPRLRRGPRPAHRALPRRVPEDHHDGGRADGQEVPRGGGRPRWRSPPAAPRRPRSRPRPTGPWSSSSSTR